jgi:hypothetical protein
MIIKMILREVGEDPAGKVKGFNPLLVDGM